LAHDPFQQFHSRPESILHLTKSLKLNVVVIMYQWAVAELSQQDAV
jgi:hypothetical protein